jgi:hypothetical protein
VDYRAAVRPRSVGRSTRATRRTRGDRWLRLPHAYWTDQHYRTLSMPAKTVLLIALSRPAGFSLPEHKGPDRYGASPDSIGDGLRELINTGLLYRDHEWVSAPRSTNGWTQRHLYTLHDAFSAVELDKAARSRDAKPDTDTDTGTDTDTVAVAVAVAGEVASEVPAGDQVIDLTAYRRSS